MKKSWLTAVALALGSLTCTTTFGQYAYTQNNFGPSSYPVQQPPMQSVLQTLPQVPAGNPYQLVNAQDPTAIYSLPTNQGVLPAPAAQPSAAQPQAGYPAAGAPAANYPAANYPAANYPAANYPAGNYPAANYPAANYPAANYPAAGYPAGDGCQTCQAPAVQYQQPINYGYQQAIAPSCTSCGPSPMMVGPSYAGGYGGHGGGKFSGLPYGAKPWFFGAGALLFNRIDNHNVGLSFLDSDYGPNIISTRDARMPMSAGVEATVGRYFNCGRNAIQATYWGLYPSEQSVYRLADMPGNYETRIPFTYMEMPPTPLPVAGYYNDSTTGFQAHQLTRSNTYHSFEVNLLGFAIGGAARNFNLSTAGTMFGGHGGGHGSRHGRSACGYCGGAGCGACGGAAYGAACGDCNTCGEEPRYATGPCCLTAPSCGSRLNLTWLTGFRYFRFTDNFLYATSTDDAFINRSATDMYYEVNTTNDLFGWQLGSRADYCIGKRLNVYGTVKVGVYNNHAKFFSRLGTDTANAYLNDTRAPVNPNNGAEYVFNESKNDVAFLSELGAGLGYRISPKWTATAGYRVVAVSGVATAPDNVRATFANYDSIRDFDNRGSLVLHGLNIGGIYNY